jgi:hypothetical protein
MREPDGTMFIVGVLVIAAVAVAAIGFGYEAYLVWYINN